MFLNFNYVRHALHKYVRYINMFRKYARYINTCINFSHKWNNINWMITFVLPPLFSTSLFKSSTLNILLILMNYLLVQMASKTHFYFYHQICVKFHNFYLLCLIIFASSDRGIKKKQFNNNTQWVMGSWTMERHERK